MMSLDELVLVIACFAVSLKLLVWSREQDVVGEDVPPDRNRDSDPRLRAEVRPDGAEGIVAAALRPGLDRR